MNYTPAGCSVAASGSDFYGFMVYQTFKVSDGKFSSLNSSLRIICHTSKHSLYTMMLSEMSLKMSYIRWYSNASRMFAIKGNLEIHSASCMDSLDLMNLCECAGFPCVAQTWSYFSSLCNSLSQFLLSYGTVLITFYESLLAFMKHFYNISTSSLK